MIHVGIDSAPISKATVTLNGKTKGEFVANLGVSVSTHDKKKFESAYEDALCELFGDFPKKRKKKIYKGAHLVAQTMEKAPEIAAKIIDNLEDVIAHIDVYCAYYSREYISIYGQSEGQRLSPPIFVKKTQNAFPHVCAMWYAETYLELEQPLRLEIDYFQSATTPGWRKLLGNVETGKLDLKFFFGGDECNPLISLADLVLKLIRIYHHGTVDGRSLLQPLREKCQSLGGGKRRTWFHNLGSRGFLIKATAPDLPLQIDAKPFLKHPIFFYLWNPRSPEKKEVMKSFQWSPAYNAIAASASLKQGGFKSFSFAEDTHIWNPDVDFMVPISKEDELNIKELEKISYKLPKICGINNLPIPI
ncbi:hypothetical protein E3J49_03000 [Candidatus Bathyarchaeota archaeon]|nr:MAG: hypothetical protein E3J49_03000 [Candidatus Bathyarchaeota archaeon]